MADEKRIQFTGVDAGYSSMMEKLRQDSQKLGRELITDARSYSNEVREQTKYIENQIAAIEKRNRLDKESQKYVLEGRRASGVISEKAFSQGMSGLDRGTREDTVQTSLLRELIDTIRNQSQKEISANREGVTQQVNEFRRAERTGDTSQYTEEQKLKLKLQDEILNPPKKAGTGMGAFGGFLMANMMRDAGGMISGFPGARSGLDFLSPSMSLAGMGMGGAAGFAADLLPLVEGAGPIGAEVGKSIGTFVGQAVERSIRTREQYEEARLRVGALSGSGYSGMGASRYGYDLIQSTQIADQLARTRGSAAGLSGSAMDYMMYQRGFGLQDNTLQGQFGLERMGMGGTRGRMSRLFSLFFGGGGDISTFSDILGAQTSLAQLFGGSMESVDETRINQVLAGVNSLGGGFSLRDPRAMGRISGLHGGLSTPGSPMSQAMNFAVLRGLNPGGSIFDLSMAQEKGLGTEGFLSGVVNQISRIGGSQDMQKMMLKRRFPQLSYSAVDRLWNNRQNLGSMSREEIETMVEDDKVATRATEATSRLTRAEADITDSFIKSFSSGILSVKDSYVEEMGEANKMVAEEFEKVFNDAISNLVIGGKNTTTIPGNPGSGTAVDLITWLSIQAAKWKSD